jgi:hypothetical protein
MGIAGSPLRDRVVFVVGSPRSGTTWITRLLGAHPEVASAGWESHLFDSGVNTLLDHYDAGKPWERYLGQYLERAEMVELVRDLCDGVFLRMRERTRPEARFVLEKTPSGGPNPEVELGRKAEVYPDGWFLHLVRDGRAVARSLLQVPWRPADSAEAAVTIWADAVRAVRETFAGWPRYLEVRYEDLREDPAEAARTLYAWLGLDGARVDGDLLRSLSGVKYASFDAASEGAKDRWQDELTRGDLKAVERAAGDLLRELGYAKERGRRTPLRAGARRAPPAVSEAISPADVPQAFAEALRSRDADRLRALAGPRFVLELRTGAGDRSARDREALDTLLALAEGAFGPPLLRQSWVLTKGEDSASVFFEGNGLDERRVDWAMLLFVEEARVTRALLISPGEPAGRPHAPLRAPVS